MKLFRNILKKNLIYILKKNLKIIISLNVNGEKIYFKILTRYVF